MRPLLIPGLPRVWRSAHSLQLGLDPARAVLLDLPDPRAARVLDLLDGCRPERLVVARAAEWGVSPEDVRALLQTLHQAGLVVAGHTLVPATLGDDARRRLTGEAASLALARVPSPAQKLRRRAEAKVLITGQGRLGAAIAVALAEGGVGHVHPDLAGPVTPAELAGGPLRATDVGRLRGEAVSAALRRAAPGVETHPIRRGAASVVIQLGYDQPETVLATAYASRRQAHLAVAVREGVAVIGPFVPATGGPCLHCVELHRRDRDAGWPGAVMPDGAEPCGVATVLAAAAYATGEVLTFLDGGSPETLGAAVEVATPGRFRRRTWPPHPACGCTRRTGLLARHGRR